MNTVRLVQLIENDNIEAFESCFERSVANNCIGDSGAWQADLLEKAIEYRRYKHIDFLCAKGIYNQATSLGYYPANGMSLKLDPKSIQILFTHGWNPSQVTNPKTGNTLLHQLARYGTYDEVDILRKIGANTSKINGALETPLDVAVRFGNAGAQEALMKSQPAIIRKDLRKQEAGTQCTFDLT